MSKDDREMKKGFKAGGASSIDLMASSGKGYRRAKMVVAKSTRTVFKIPLSSHLDAAAIKRKARDVARRFEKQNTNTLTW